MQYIYIYIYIYIYYVYALHILIIVNSQQDLLFCSKTSKKYQKKTSLMSDDSDLNRMICTYSHLHDDCLFFFPQKQNQVRGRGKMHAQVLASTLSYWQDSDLRASKSASDLRCLYCGISHAIFRHTRIRVCTYLK
jgi:hypothetical protein